jgi:hypothetical protein
MSDKILVLVTDTGKRWPVKDRTAGMIAEVYLWQERLERCKMGQLVIDFKDGDLKSSFREYSERRPIE